MGPTKYTCVGFTIGDALMVIGCTWTKSLESFNVKAKADGGYYEANAILEE
jgi:hypothetical protein